MNQLITMLLQKHNLKIVKNIGTSGGTVATVTTYAVATTTTSSSLTTMDRVANSTIVQFDTNSNPINISGNNASASSTSSLGTSSSNNNESNHKDMHSFYSGNIIINAEEGDEAAMTSTLKSAMLNVDSENNFYSVSPSTLTSFESARSGEPLGAGQSSLSTEDVKASLED